jgi:type IV pilus assembly protein PilM
MTNRVTTLYLEDNSIKLLVANGRQVERWVSVPLEPDLVSAGAIVNENKVAEKIQEAFVALKRLKPGKKGKRSVGKWLSNLFSGQGKLIIGLSGRESLYRVVALPVLAEGALAEAVNREAARVFPVSLDELYLAYQRIPGFANETRVFVAAYPKNITNTLIRTLRIAGIAPRYLDLAPLALCNSVNEPRSIIVDVRQDSLNIIVMAGRVPQVIRSLALQSEEKTVSENLTTIAEEFSRTVAFYNSTHQQELLDETVPVFVSSDLAKEPDSWKTVVGALGAKVAVLPSVFEFSEDFPANDYAVNLGLATKELNLDKETANYSLINLNALPAALIPKQFNWMRVLIPVTAVVGIAAIVFLFMAWQSNTSTNKSLESQLANTQVLAQKSAADIATLTEQNRLIEAQIQPMMGYAAIFTTKMSALSEARVLIDSDVHQIVALKPSAVIMTGMAHSGSAMTVTGGASSYQQVLDYALALRDTAGFSTLVASIGYSPETTDEGVVIQKYNYTFQMK